MLEIKIVHQLWTELREQRQTRVKLLVWQEQIKADSVSHFRSPSDLRCGRAGSGHLLAGGLQDGGTDPQPGVWEHTDHQWHHHHLRVLPWFPGSSEGEPLPPAHGTAQTALVQCEWHFN